MAKIQNISEIHPTLGFTEFDIQEKYRKSFHASELGSLHSVFPFESIAKEIGLSQPRLGRRNCFSPSVKITLMVLKAYTGFSDRLLDAFSYGHEAPLGKYRMALPAYLILEKWHKSFLFAIEKRHSVIIAFNNRINKNRL